MTIQAKQQPDFPVYAAGIYLARCKGATVFTAKPNKFHPEPYDKIRWEWDIKLPGIKEPQRYSTFTSLSLHPNSYLPGLLKAIGVATNEDGSFEESDCTSKLAWLVVEEKIGTDGKTFNETTKYAPYVRGQAAPTVEAATPAPAPMPASPNGGVAVATAPAAAPAAADDNPFDDEGDAIPF